jgi:hypothetical protein
MYLKWYEGFAFYKAQYDDEKQKNNVCVIEVDSLKSAVSYKDSVVKANEEIIEIHEKDIEKYNEELQRYNNKVKRKNIALGVLGIIALVAIVL